MHVIYEYVLAPVKIIYCSLYIDIQKLSVACIRTALLNDEALASVPTIIAQLGWSSLHNAVSQYYLYQTSTHVYLSNGILYLSTSTYTALETTQH